MVLILGLASTSFAEEDDWPDGIGIPQLNLRGFGNLNYSVDRSANETNNNFANGGLDLFLSASLAPSLDFLNETVFEFGENGENILDVERVQVKWHRYDWAQVTIGRQHTPLGYWNEYYHHGTWLQNTTSRPLIYLFEDDGGLLPVHFVGLLVEGSIPTEIAVFSYKLTVSNGRGRIPDAVQLVEDRNDSKSWLIQFRVEPTAVPGLVFGANASGDRIPSNPDIAADPGMGVTGRDNSIAESIYGGHLRYENQNFSILAEGLVILHRDGSGGAIGRQIHHGGYVETSYAVKLLKPYFRFDWLRIDEEDPFFQDEFGKLLDGVEDQERYTAGIRFDASTWAAITVEYSHTSAESGARDSGTLALSFAF